MASNMNSSSFAHDNSFGRNEAYLQNNGLIGYDPTLSNDGAAASDQSWGFANDRLNLTQSPSSSLFPHVGWQGSGQPQPISAAAGQDHSPNFYPSSFQNDLSSFNSASVFKDASLYNGHARPVFGQSITGNGQQGSNSMPPSFHPNSSSTFSDNADHLSTVAPGALQNNASNAVIPPSIVAFQSGAPQRTAPSQPVFSSIPKGSLFGSFLIISPESLNATNETRKLHNYVNIGDSPQEIVVTKSTIPAYIPRKSRNEIKLLLATDDRLKANVAKKAKSAKNGSKVTLAAAADPLKSGGSKKPAPASPSSSDSSEEESESESEEETMKPPLPATRPTNAMDAVKYDTIKTLWRVPYRSAADQDIRKGLGEFGEIVTTIRDRWKSDAQAVKQAEESKKARELPTLKERVASQREQLHVALKSAVAEGHKDIVELLGENIQLMVALAQFLLDRAKDTDYNGPLTRALLELISKCKTLTEGNLEKTGIAKILPRFAKRGDEITKSLVKKIEGNAGAASKKKKESVRTGTSVAVSNKDAKGSAQNTVAKTNSPIAGVKRSRPTDGGNGEQPQKKVAGDVKISSPQTKKPAGADVKTAVTPATKPTVTKITANKNNYFSQLTSAKKTTPSAVKLNSANKANTGVKYVAATTQHKPSFSFAETIASLNKPKEVESTSKDKEESNPSETEDQRLKRLRKEERRKLKVTFKPDNDLVDIRYFRHDPEEELGHDDSQVRDAGDLESEGRMFKLKQQQHLMDLDDEDEEEEEEEEAAAALFAQPWSTPSKIDFSVIPEQEQNRNYQPYGGGTMKPETPEVEAQQQREANTLLVVYSQTSDIPYSPKEPPETKEESLDCHNFGAPPEHVLKRAIESAEHAQRAPIVVSESVMSAPFSGTNLSALLNNIQPQPSQPQPIQNPMTDLEKIFAQYSSPSGSSGSNSQQSPYAQAQPNGQQNGLSFNLQNVFGGQSQQNAFPPPYQSTNQASGSSVPDLSAILAALNQAQQLQQVPSTASMGSFNTQAQTSAASLLAQNPVQQQDQQTQAYPYENEERKRWRESGAAEQDGSKGNGGRQKIQWNLNKTKDGKPTPMFVVPCKYWREGKCKKGADCTFKHE